MVDYSIGYARCSDEDSFKETNNELFGNKSQHLNSKKENKAKNTF